MPTAYDIPLHGLGNIVPGSSENVEIARAILTLMQELDPGEYVLSDGANAPVPTVIRAVEAKFGVDGPVARLIRRVLQ